MIEAVFTFLIGVPGSITEPSKINKSVPFTKKNKGIFWENAWDIWCHRGFK